MFTVSKQKPFRHLSVPPESFLARPIAYQLDSGLDESINSAKMSILHPFHYENKTKYLKILKKFFIKLIPDRSIAYQYYVGISRCLPASC